MSDPEPDRYSRLRLIQWWQQERVKEARILVVGAGALGNEVLKNLALAGVGRVFIVDFDKVEVSNLSRAILFRSEDAGKYKAPVAAERITEINSDVQAKSIVADINWDIGLGFVRRMDVVIACLDNREARLSLNRLCWRTSVPWVDGGLDEFTGLARVFVPPAGACYECTLSDTDYEFLGMRYSCTPVDPSTLITHPTPTTPTTASIIAAIQVQEALKLLHRPEGVSLLEGKGLLFDGLANTVDSITYPRSVTCSSHETYTSIHELPEASVNWSLNCFLRFVAKRWKLTNAVIELRYELVLTLDCLTCGGHEAVLAPL
ncbi:MAG TPA: ThiF family adenylyltransferase, partial [Chloroflexia bacterium]